MIKIEDVELCGTITRSACVKQTKDGASFLSMTVKVLIKSRDNMGTQELYVNVSFDGNKSTCSSYAENRKVLLNGSIWVNKVGEKTYYNMRADTSRLVKSTTEDQIVGKMVFRGRVSKNGVKVMTNKSGKEYYLFSAYSSERRDDNFTYTWVHFIYFGESDPEVLAPDKYIEVNAQLQFRIYKDELRLEGVAEDIAEWSLSRQE